VIDSLITVLAVIAASITAGLLVGYALVVAHRTLVKATLALLTTTANRDHVEPGIHYYLDDDRAFHHDTLRYKTALLMARVLIPGHWRVIAIYLNR
jgi:hypothetical protein